MTLLSDWNPTQKETCLFMGPHGTGKTIAASQWPRPIKLMSADGRIKPVWEYWNRTDPAALKEIDFDVYTAGEFTRLAKTIENLQINNKFKTVILDPLGAVGNMAIEFSISLRDPGSKSAKSLNIGPLIKLRSIEDYGAEDRALTQMMDIGRVITAHFIVIAHVLTIEYYGLTDDKPRIEERLLTAGKTVAASLPGYFDEVWRFMTRPSANVGSGDEFLVRTSGGGAKTARQLPPLIDWTNKNLYSKTHPQPNT